MLSFENDYIAGAHPAVLEALTKTNLIPLPGYGTDPICEQAKEKIRKACQCPNGQVEFLVGGTQTNTMVISSMLRDFEGVVAAPTGHVSVHEAGAIENAGHKVLCLPENPDSSDTARGKICPEGLRKMLESFYQDANNEHMVFPGMVYISHPTEYGTLYSKKELEEIYTICKEYKLPLYIDGARLAYGLESKNTDLSLPELTALCDVFYIGGTKCGTLCGEAVVFTKGNRPPHFMNFIKKRGALLAKGRLLGVQFDALFTDDLYLQIGRHGIEKAEQLKEILHKNQIPFFLETPTNQQFVILENTRMEQLKSRVAFSFWEPFDETHTVVRFATSWCTTDEDLKNLDQIL